MQQLYNEVTGSGPPLVLIPGGGGDAGMYEDVVPVVGEYRTVITFDRRGNSRSPLTSPDAPVDAASQADDVIALLDRLEVPGAAVFGSSGGAIIALDLVARHPDRLTCVVAHEPPLVTVLEPDSPERRALEEIDRLSRERGVLRAFAAFGAMTMPSPPWLFRSDIGQAMVAAGSRLLLTIGDHVRRISGAQPGTMTRMLQNTDILFERELPELCFGYTADIDALKDSPIPWALVTGADSVGRPYHRPAHVLAAQTGANCMEFSGGHTIYQQDPEGFAEHLLGLVKEMEHCREQG